MAAQNSRTWASDTTVRPATCSASTCAAGVGSRPWSNVRVRSGEDEHQLPTRSQHAPELAQGRQRIGQVLQDVAGDDRVERGVGEWGQPVGVEVEVEVGRRTPGAPTSSG
jgi:hypothetical protein